MTKHTKGVPGNMSAAHIAGRAIFARGPSTQEQVLGYTSFGTTAGAQSHNLGKAIASGWFVQLAPDLIGLSEKARHYYAGTEPEPKQMGSLATPRENLHAMEPLSRKYHLNVKGPRADVPDVRAYPSVYDKVTP